MSVTREPFEPRGAAAAWVLARREVLRFLRQPARIVAAVATPALLWVFLSAGLTGVMDRNLTGDSAVAFGAFLLPGTLTLVAMFASIFSAISVIEDRDQGWLQAVLVSPAPRWSIALGKIAGGSILAFAQAAVLLPLFALQGGVPGPASAGSAVLALLITCVGVTGMGVVLAWRCESSQSFHAVMNLVFMPMWLLSGAFFPIDDAAGWLSALGWINPLTWCTEAIRRPLLGQDVGPMLWLTIAYAMTMLLAATVIVSRPGKTAA